MPRDGSGQYSQPFPPVVEGTTIESTVYNGYTADITLDLNTARPISVGGTGAENAADAMANLGGEISKIEVTNYDSHPFQPGSFYSKASASGAPVASHAFAGYCYVAVVSGVSTSDMFIEVRDRDEPTQPGSLYVRQKKAGVWSSWMKPVGTASGTTPPTPASANALWWDPTRGKLFIYYSDADTSQWVEAVAVPDVNADEVQDIVDATVAAKAVRYDVAQTLTANQQAQARANIDVTKKNYIINGAMLISQENGTNNVPIIGSAGYPADMFIASGASSSGTVNAAQVVSRTPGGSPVRLRVGCQVADTSIAASEYLQIYQIFEGYRVADLKLGTGSAKTVTLQFGVKAPAGTYCVTFRNGAANRSYVAEYVISAGEANTDVVKSITLTLDTTGTWPTDNTASLVIHWWLMGGSSFVTATPNVWNGTVVYITANQFNFMGQTAQFFELFDVSLTEGSVAPPFVVPDYASELQLCRRYFYNGSPPLRGVVATAGVQAQRMGCRHPVAMRAGPVLTITGPLALFDGTTGGTTGGAPTANYSSPEVLEFDINVSVGFGAGRPLICYQSAGNINVSARL